MEMTDSESEKEESDESGTSKKDKETQLVRPRKLKLYTMKYWWRSEAVSIECLNYILMLYLVINLIFHCSWITFFAKLSIQ